MIHVGRSAIKRFQFVGENDEQIDDRSGDEGQNDGDLRLFALRGNARIVPIVLSIGP